MIFSEKRTRVRRLRGFPAWAAAGILTTGMLFTNPVSAAEQNLLKNPGFEDAASGADTLPNWATSAESGQSYAH